MGKGDRVLMLYGYCAAVKGMVFKQFSFGWGIKTGEFGLEWCVGYKDTKH